MPNSNLSIFHHLNQTLKNRRQKIEVFQDMSTEKTKIKLCPHTERFNQPGKKKKAKQNNNTLLPHLVFFFGAFQRKSLHFTSPYLKITFTILTEPLVIVVLETTILTGYSFSQANLERLSQTFLIDWVFYLLSLSVFFFFCTDLRKAWTWMSSLRVQRNFKHYNICCAYFL